jgi:Rieske 2Fe-2S family protein
MPIPRPSASDHDPAAIGRLVGEYRPGGPLPGPFYTSAAVFAADMARIWRRFWLYTGHGCMIPEPGDWMTWTLGRDSIVLVRTHSGEIKGFHNTCRHRGARICREERGKGRALACPYHGWTYDLDGALKNRTETEFGVHQSALGLHPVPLKDAGGLLFVALGDDPVSFDDALADLAPRMRHQGFADAKVAAARRYTVKANWKLIFENNRECYHCPLAHPEYTRATFDVARTSPSGAKLVERQTALANERFREMGLDTGDAWSNMSGEYWRVTRAPLAEGFETQSLDGKPVSSLMGRMRELGRRSDGTLRSTVFPNFWQHASDDYAAATRITPVDAETTIVDVSWLVHKDAVEGKDYDLAALLPFWQRTSEQDWAICEANQMGVSSPRYVPGPYSKLVEGNVQRFVDWYLGELQPRRRPKAARRR